MYFSISCLLTAFFRKMISSLRCTVLILSVPLLPVFVLAQGTPKTTEKAGSSLLQLPEPSGWYSGDIHVHRNCGDGTSVTNTDQLVSMMETNRLSFISLLADMGNGEVKYAAADMPRVNGTDDSLSRFNRIIHWDAEWHWDATYSNFSHQALGGHLVLLGLKEAHQIWDESPYKVLEWARKQDAVTGFAHFEYLKDSFQKDLNCCIPVDYPVEAALGTIDFVSEDVFAVGSPNSGNYNSEAAIQAWYKLLNCGFRIALAAGTDFPCNDSEPPGRLLTYVNTGNKQIGYDSWIRALKAGKTVVSRSGHEEFLDLKVNGTSGPGDQIRMAGNKPVKCSVTWTSQKACSGSIELICNGKVVYTRQGSVKPGEPMQISFTQPVRGSSWICARRMGTAGHVVHTGPVYLAVNKKPVRASAADADYFTGWIDQVLGKTAPGAEWSRYFTHDQETVRARYLKARKIFEKISHESKTN